MIINTKNLNKENVTELFKVCKEMGPMTVLLIKDDGEIMVSVVEQGYNVNDYKAISKPFCVNNVPLGDYAEIIKKIKLGYDNGGIFGLGI